MYMYRTSPILLILENFFQWKNRAVHGTKAFRDARLVKLSNSVPSAWKALQPLRRGSNVLAELKVQAILTLIIISSMLVPQRRMADPRPCRGIIARDQRRCFTQELSK